MSAPDPRIVPEGTRSKKRWWLALGSLSLWLSILFHVLVAAGATAFVVSQFSKKPRTNFVSAPPPPAHTEVEHKIEMAKRNDSGSAPPDLKRITTTDVSPIALPDVPDTPVTDVAVPVTMAGDGDLGEGLGSGPGTGSGDGGSPFGIPDSTAPGLKGNLYDLKQTKDGKSTGMTPKKYHGVLAQFVAADWDPNVLNAYYRANKTLDTDAIFIPTIRATDGPKAFGVENEVQPNMYVVWYKMRAAPTQDGTYHFVGLGDDILLVRVNGQTVLDGSLGAVKGDLQSTEKRYGLLNYKPTDSTERAGLFVGRAVALRANDMADIEILIGEEPGGWSNFFLYIQRDESSYVHQSNDTPLLPIFQVDTKKIAPTGAPRTFPAYAPVSDPWRAEGADAAPSP